ncbi:MAG: site-specific integrase [Candidatus Omnitrophica bacterium]|nr:site-specific integrase [Candidatus Omnitrophota bacterium]MDE2231890.1 site-specific integrase [Candidatus Omnitrophota bacterium]
MAVFNRVSCPDCGHYHNVYDKQIRKICCKGCDRKIAVDPRKGNFFMERYFNGRRIREKVGPDRRLAEIADDKRKVEIAEGKFLDKKKEQRIKFEDFADEFLEVYCKPNLKSWDRFSANNLNILKRYFSGKCLHEITPHLIEKFKADRLQDTTRKKKGLKPATVNRQLIVLKSLFNRAIDWGKFQGQNPVRKVKFFKENNTRVRFLEPNELVKLLSFCRGILKPIVLVALHTGMRKGEILGLKWRDCDFRRSIIYLLDTKNGQRREVPMNEAVKTALIRVRRNPQSEYIFCHKDGAQIKDIKKSFFTAITKSGIKDFHFHDLRHCCASYLVMNGVALNTVREILGHKSMDMTLRYAHLSPDHRKQAVDLLAKKIDTFWTPEQKAESSPNLYIS